MLLAPSGIFRHLPGMSGKCQEFDFSGLVGTLYLWNVLTWIISVMHSLRSLSLRNKF